MQIGDVVELRSGGPKMTVSFIDGASLYCKWFVGEQVQEASFTEPSLRLAEEQGGPFRVSESSSL